LCLRATAAGTATTAVAASPQRQRSTFLDLGEPMVAGLARHPRRRQCGHGATLAPSRLEGLLALAVETRSKGGSASYCAGATGPDRAHGRGKSIVGTAKDPSRIGEARVQSVCQNRRQVHATTHASKAITGLAVILKQHAATIWACDFSCVQTILFRTFYVFFVIHHASRQVLHVHVTPHPTAEWTAQQIVECCGWDYEPLRFLVHDRDNCYGTSFDRRVRRLGIAQVRTPFRSPRANAIAERWVRSVRTECLDYVFIFNERHLEKVLAEHVGYFNHWRPHRSIGQRAPCAPSTPAPHRSAKTGKIIAIPVLGGLHHVYHQAA
jgi:transposase InsO family protein